MAGLDPAIQLPGRRFVSARPNPTNVILAPGSSPGQALGAGIHSKSFSGNSNDAKYVPWNGSL